jgi:elongator complex protein 6
MKLFSCIVKFLAPPSFSQSKFKMSSRIPPLLEPYLSLPPEASIILLTSVLGASSNWLVLRFLHTALISPDFPSEIQGEDEAKVVLVSFMRDIAFWKENAKRLVGSISALESCLSMFMFRSF